MIRLALVALYSNLKFFSQKEIINFPRDAAEGPITEATGVNTEKGRIMEIILENEEKCSEKMKRDPPYNKSGTDII